MSSFSPHWGSCGFVAGSAVPPRWSQAGTWPPKKRLQAEPDSDVDSGNRATLPLTRSSIRWRRRKPVFFPCYTHAIAGRSSRLYLACILAKLRFLLLIMLLIKWCGGRARLRAREESGRGRAKIRVRHRLPRRPAGLVCLPLNRLMFFPRFPLSIGDSAVDTGPAFVRVGDRFSRTNSIEHYS
jgi:hypothetical protein